MYIIDTKPSNVQRTYFANAFRRFILFIGMIVFVTAFPLQASSEPKWSLDVDATAPDFLQENAFGDLEYGYTDVVPPFTLPRYYKATQGTDGYAWEIQGTELSLWQLSPVPENARYLLTWHFLYEGAITGGRGRTGFIFGNPVSTNLMSVEVTAAGSLRLVMWGKQGFERQGRIVFSRQATRNTPVVKIEASYSIRSGTMTCRVNDGEEILIDFKKYTPSAPITIRGMGFFSAVPEAPHNMNVFGQRRSSNYDIDLSPRWAKTLHRKLTVSAE